MTSKKCSGLEIPDGEAYKRAEKMFYCQQLGMNFREIGEKLGVDRSVVHRSLNHRNMLVSRHLAIKALDERRLGLE